MVYIQHPLSCLGISQDNFQSTLNAAKISCAEMLPEQMQSSEREHFITEFGNCVTDGMRSHFDISQTVIDECEAGDTSAESTIEKAARMLNQGLKLHANMSDIKQVTLPLYSSHEVISHFPEGMGNYLGAESLPVAIIATNDDINKVIQFYQSKLPKYKKIAVENGVIFMKTAPADFDLLTHIGLYTSTPHVLIEDMQHSLIASQEGKVKIEISYQRQ